MAYARAPMYTPLGMPGMPTDRTLTYEEWLQVTGRSPQQKTQKGTNAGDVAKTVAKTVAKKQLAGAAKEALFSSAATPASQAAWNTAAGNAAQAAWNAGATQAGGGLASGAADAGAAWNAGATQAGGGLASGGSSAPGLGLSPNAALGLGAAWMAAAPITAPLVQKGGNWAAKKLGFTDSRPERNSAKEIESGEIFSKAPNELWDLGNQISGYNELSNEMKADLLNKAKAAKVLNIAGSEGQRAGERINFDDYLTIGPGGEVQKGRAFLSTNQRAEGPRRSSIGPSQVPTLDQLNQATWINPERRAALVEFLKARDAATQAPQMQAPPGMNDKVARGTLPPNWTEGAQNAQYILNPPTPAPIMIPRSKTLSPGIGLDGKRISY